jgi:8-oxo-dGTP pyrophosphatase MutT (NUDIX family)
MHRAMLLRLLELHRARHPEDTARAERIADFARAHADCFERTNRLGHVTGSAWIVSADRTRYLLTHHRKLGRWLQLGGHADGDPDPLRVALREAREESGMRDFELPEPRGELLDVDVHSIPARGGEPAHLHHDVRFLLIAGPDQPLVPSSESVELRWFPIASDAPLAGEASLLRMSQRARERLGVR